MSQTSRPSGLRSAASFAISAAGGRRKSGVRRRRRRSRRMVDRGTRDSPPRRIAVGRGRFCVVAVLRGSNVRRRHVDADQLRCRQRVRQPENQRSGATSKIEQSNWSIPWHMLEHDVAHPIRPLRWRGAGLGGKSACGVARHTDSNSTRAGVLNANRSGRSLHVLEEPAIGTEQRRIAAEPALAMRQQNDDAPVPWR